MIIKVTNTEISIATANTVYGAKVIRVVNPTTGNVVLTIGNATVNGTITVLGNSSVIIEKEIHSHTLAGTGLLAAPVTYKN